MKPLITIVVLIGAVLLGTASQAQSECGNGLPCGPVPWRLPKLPDLNSPTPRPTIDPAAQPTAAPTSANAGGSFPRATMMPTATGTQDLSNLVAEFPQHLATVDAMMNATTVCVRGVSNSECVDVADTTASLAPNVLTFFSYARALAGLDVGVFNPLIQFVVIGFSTVLTVKILYFLAPMIATLIGLIRKLISIILEFIPL